ncbi:MAG: alpha/beta fold hydrolase [Chlorobaculum sp.]|nr:alpha/beta fold hydrolase [Chlorobaculum sp.]
MTNRVSHEPPQRRLTGVVILHGFTANLESVRELFGPLGRFDLRIDAPLLRGHGAASPDDLRGVTWKEWLEDAERALVALTGLGGKAVVIGHSMGALLALQLAARRPELVDSLILATPPVRLASPLAPGRPLHFLAPLISYVVDRWNMESKYADPGSAIMPKQYEWAPTRAILSMFELLEETTRITDRVRAPALILHCRRESIVLPESAELLLRSIATQPEKKSIVWFEKSDHQIFCDCERKEAVEAAVRFVASRVEHQPANP